MIHRRPKPQSASTIDTLRILTGVAAPGVSAIALVRPLMMVV